MKKVLYIFLAFHMLSLMSCCEEDYRIVGFQEIGAFQDRLLQEPLTTVDGPFLIFAGVERVVANLGIHNPFVNQAYATTCGENFLNTVNMESITVSANKPYQFMGNEVSANTDMIGTNGIVVSEDFGSFYIDFMSAFVDNADFPEGTYSFTVSFTTSDGTTYSETIDLDMQI